MSAFHDNALIGASGQQGYKISRSVRLRSSASAYFNRTFSTPTNQKKWTLSCWVKRGALSSTGEIFNGAQSGTNDNYIRFTGGNALMMGSYNGVGTDYGIVTTAVFRDPSAWYHCVFVYDVDNATSTDRAIIYVNGVRQAVSNNGNGMFPSGYTSAAWNTAVSHRISSNSPSAIYSDQYLTEMVFVDGQALTPSSFGETDTLTGVWKPKKYAGTYGTNGFYLNFSDNSAATAAAIGKDYSGNGNNWTPNNISVTSGVTYDSMLDVPTSYDDGTVYDRGNYPVINPLNNSGGTTIADGNLKTTWGSASSRSVLNTMAIPSSGKFYAEFVVGTLTSASVAASFGLATESVARTSDGYGASGAWVYYASNQSYISRNGTSSAQIGSNQTFAAGGIVQVAVDRTNNQAWLGYNNVWVNATNGTDGNPSAGTNPTVSSLPADLFIIMGLYANSGNVNFGQRPFSYTPPTGFVALNTQNLPTPTISNGAQYMAATLYSGNSGTQSITNTVNGVAMEPGLVWGKSRNIAENHALFDIVRGVNKTLYANLTNAEATDPGVSAFNSNGFTLNGATMNATGYTYVAWQWKAGGTAVSNTAGTITSSVSAGATQGFSVVTWTGNGTNGATVGHSLGVAPKMVIVKRRSAIESWGVYHASLPSAAYYLILNSTAAQDGTGGTIWNSTAPSSTVLTLGTSTYSNANTSTYVAYCFAEVAGYSKFGSYTGNGSADGPFVFCGFRPRFILFKSSTYVGSFWNILDTSRDTYNVAQERLYPNSSAASQNTSVVDILSNGFKARSANSDFNQSGETYIFAAFAENPLKNSLAR